MSEIFNNIIYMARRFRLATAFNMLGLIVAFAAFYLMMTQIIFQASYNHGIEDCDRLYRLDTDFLNNNKLYSEEVFYPFAKALDSLPEVESVSLVPYIDDNSIYASYYTLPFQKKDKQTVTFTCEFGCNETAISTLVSNSKVASGSIDWSNAAGDPMPGRRGIIIPRSIAQEYFGRVDVAKDSMMYVYTYDDGTESLTPWTIRGVYEDFPENSEFRNYIYALNDSIDQLKYNFDTPFKCFIKFKEAPEDVEALTLRLKNAILGMMEKEGWDKYEQSAGMTAETLRQSIDDMKVGLTPLTGSYFATNSLSSGKHGLKTLFIIFSLACLMLMIIATIHFLNFLLVESPMRIRGINTRLVMGATRHTLRQGIVTECVIMAVMAAIVALVICAVLSHWHAVNQLFEGSIALQDNWLLAVLTVLIAGAVGFVAGLYPAIFATSFVPAMALKGNLGLTPQGHKLRKTLIALQLFFSFLIAIYLGILLLERDYIFNSDYNYIHHQVLMSTVPLGTSDSIKRELCNELIAVPGIENVSFSDGSMGLTDKHGAQLAEVSGHSFSFDYTHVDTAYLNTMGITVIEGRNFLPSDTAAAIINQAARERWSWLRIGMKIPNLYNNNDSLTIVGVCNDIRYNTTRIHSNQPFVFLLQPEATRVHLNARIDSSANLSEIKKLAAAIIHKHIGDSSSKQPNPSAETLDMTRHIYPTPLSSFNDKLKEPYEIEFRFFKWIAILSIICMAIMLIGVFCLTLFEAEYRRKEIGIRKVAGATTGEIVSMLCRQYVPLILISFACAVPIALLSGWLTLNYFAEHVDIHGWITPITLLALLLVGGIAMATIVLQSWRTARENPVNSIKTE